MSAAAAIAGTVGTTAVTDPADACIYPDAAPMSHRRERRREQLYREKMTTNTAAPAGTAVADPPDTHTPRGCHTNVAQMRTTERTSLLRQND
jgi:hypothetical protein